MEKSYMKTIMEDLAPCLLNVIKTPNRKYKLKYVFNIEGIPNLHVRTLFTEKVINHLNWRHPTHYTYVWYTNSVKLDEWYGRQEKVEDIPTHMSDALSYVVGTVPPILNIKSTLTGRFKTKEEIMKFSATHSININVNGQAFTIQDPVDKDEALKVVSELAKRAQALRDQVDNLELVSNTSNVSVVLKDEITSINDFIMYIDENIKD